MLRIDPHTRKPFTFHPYRGTTRTLRTNADRSLERIINRAVADAFRPNERGDDNDRRQIVADLISNDRSPFLPEDEDSLRAMSEDTLRRMRDDYLPEGEPAAPGEGEDEEMRTRLAKLSAYAGERAAVLYGMSTHQLRALCAHHAAAYFGSRPSADAAAIASMTTFEQPSVADRREAYLHTRAERKQTALDTARGRKKRNTHVGSGIGPDREPA